MVKSFIIFSFVASLIGLMYAGIIGSYQYENQYSCYWDLAEKASTLAQKSKYIDSFTIALEKGNFKGKYNAMWLKTPDNSFDKNFEALASLQSRLNEIQKMDINSFQYQSAMEQITKQEQGEANKMVHVFQGIWCKEHWLIMWDWVGIIMISLCVLTGFISCIIIIEFFI